MLYCDSFKKDNAVAVPYRDFLDMFSPIKQRDYCAGTARALRCVESTTAPTLLEAVNAYGRNKVVAWMMLQIYNLSEVAGCRDKITDAACEDAATFLVTEYPYYRVSEIMLFFWRCKFGSFGRFYGAVDVQTLAEWFHKFRGYVNGLLRESERHRQGYYRDECPTSPTNAPCCDFGSRAEGL